MAQAGEGWCTCKTAAGMVRLKQGLAMVCPWLASADTCFVWCSGYHPGIQGWISRARWIGWLQAGADWRHERRLRRHERLPSCGLCFVRCELAK